MADPYPEPDPTLSSDARFSTYEQYQQTDEEKAMNPPPGPATVQTKGKPSESGGQQTQQSSSRSKATSS
jgi:hypothetical protein